MSNEEKFIKGFNGGYLLNQHEPKLLDQILSGQESKDDYFQGLREGRKQHEKEKFLEQMKDSQKGKDKGRSL